MQQGRQQFSTRLDGHDSALQVVAHTAAAGDSSAGSGTAGRSRIVADGLADSAVCHRRGATRCFHFAGRPWAVTDRSRAAASRAGTGASDGKLRASMNGRVVALQVAVGDTLAAGQPLLALEAMKMEHVHTAPCTGRVAALHVSLGEQVAAHSVVVEIEPALPAAALPVAAVPATELPAAELPAAPGSAAAG